MVALSPRPFILPPCSVTLHFNSKIDKAKLWESLVDLERKHHLFTSHGFPVFGPEKYVGCVGSQPRRAGVGVRTTSHVQNVAEETWEVIVDFV